MYALKTRYIVFRVPIKGAGINIEKISQKIPKDFVLITGYKATVRKQSVGGIPDATISLSFNNKASNPIVMEADKPIIKATLGDAFCSLNQFPQINWILEFRGNYRSMLQYYSHPQKVYRHSSLIWSTDV